MIKITGIYRKEESEYWQSTEVFCKDGEIRMIDNKLHSLVFTVWPIRFWSEINNDGEVVKLVDKYFKRKRHANTWLEHHNDKM